MSEHIETRNKIKSIHRKVEFDDLIEGSMLTDKEKCMMRMFYLEGRDFGYIADKLGYSQAGIAKMHKRALKKVESLL